MSEEQASRSLNFIEQIIEGDLSSKKHETIVTRFPPEPNGYLHIGHAKSICLNFGLAKQYKGKVNLRFDDTNPDKESTEYVESIKKDIEWLGFEWQKECYTSDYFQQLYNWGIVLIKKGLAYVDHSSAEQIAQMKGTPTKAGTNSPYRERSVDENLALFEQMKNGAFENGTCVLRAKIDMSSPNMHLRDPLMYRIKHSTHHRTGDDWCIYPIYDWAHGQSDSIENITHSLCSLEFEIHRPLYNWFIENLEIYPSRQIEFARLNLDYTVMSKRKLLRLVEENLVDGWDDPRLPTISGMRRRGYPAAAIRTFCAKAGIAKRENIIELSLLESCVRQELNKTALRAMAVLDPVKLIITNYPEGQTEQLTAQNNPEDEQAGSREIPFSKELYIERADFLEDAPKKFFRLSVGRNVRLKHAYIINCTGFKKDEEGNLLEVYATYYKDSKSGQDVSGIKPKGTLHWVSTQHAQTAQVRQYDRLFMNQSPDQTETDFIENINPDSLSIIDKAYIEPSLQKSKKGAVYQFMRIGYYARDAKSDQLVFNRTVTLKDGWAKKNK